MHTFSSLKNTVRFFILFALILSLVAPTTLAIGTSAHATDTPAVTDTIPEGDGQPPAPPEDALPPAPPEEGAPEPAPAEPDPNERIDLILTTEESNRTGVPEDWNFWVGKQFGITSGFVASGANVNIPGATFTLKISKSPYLTKPEFTSSNAANRTAEREDKDAWYVDYLYDPLRGGVFSKVTTTLSFNDGITPPGTEIPVEWTLFDANKKPLQTIQKSLIARAEMDYSTIIRPIAFSEGNTGCEWYGQRLANNTHTLKCNFTVLDPNASTTETCEKALTTLT